ncbi:hypothetical protein A0256_02780 [Mucilaginibacter sp. PAMC 26640]|nr:hypothetical protein A0256_02780 [Mucilaginibacter sp. PAMC 26640]
MNNIHRFSSDELLQVLALSQNATAIYSTRDLIIQTANDAMLGLWGRGREAIGQPLQKAVPELEGQPFIAILQEVWDTGVIYTANDTPALLNLTGRLNTYYFDFVYRPIKNVAGNVYCILHTATDVTERYKNRQKLLNASKTEDELNREQALNEQLQVTNEELNATNEQLKDIQLKLSNLNLELEEKVLRRTAALAESEANFRNMILQAPVAMALFKGPDMVIDMINGTFLELWGRDRSVVGKPLVEALPELKDQPYLQIIGEVFNSGRPYFGVEAEVMLNRSGQLSKGYYNFVNHPFKDAYGKITGVIVVAGEVTEQVLAGNKVKHSEHRLRTMIMSTPISMAVLQGRELVITVANQSMLDIWGRTEEQVINERLIAVFPELLDQPFPKLLNDVFETGEKLAIREIAADIATPAGLKHIYVDFSYDPLFDQSGNVESILVSVIEITDIVHARKQLEESEAEQQALNEEIQAANEEMAATNEELHATNEELSETQLDLRRIIDALETSEGRLRYMLADAPIAIALLTGPQLIVEAANKKVLEAWGKDSHIVGLPLAEAVPELAGQAFIDLLLNVYQTGEAYYGNEVKARLEQNGKMEEVYSNFVYHPLKDSAGQTTSIILIANVVTEQVIARREIEKAEEKARFAIEAANVGTWFLNINTREFVVSQRLKEQFGYKPDDEVSYDMIANAIPEEYRRNVTDAVDKAIASGKNYEMEHPVISHADQKIQWVRAYGKLYPDSEGSLSHFSGIIMDITEQKHDEIRKNDFIGMVSHELKTPLTSLSAYSQMLYSKARNGGDPFTIGALEKVNSQVKKMSTMINGFLNVSRLESGKIFLNKEQFRLDELVEEMIADARLTFNSHQITFIHSEPVTLIADMDKIGSVISNLLSNAVKYSPRGKNISLECRINGGDAMVSVKDEGMGIKPNDIDRIFERYYRVDSAHTQTVSGFGIGLYLCAEIVERHHGKIWVESEKAQGSTFYFTLPVN